VVGRKGHAVNVVVAVNVDADDCYCCFVDECRWKRGALGVAMGGEESVLNN